MGAAASVSEDPSPNELKALSAAIEANFTPGKQLTKAGLTALRQEFATNLATAEERAHDQEIEVTLSIEGAGDLADRDGAGNDSDPFATIDVTYVAERYQTKVINGNLNPTWNETFSFTLGADLIAATACSHARGGAILSRQGCQRESLRRGWSNLLQG